LPIPGLFPTHHFFSKPLPLLAMVEAKEFRLLLVFCFRFVARQFNQVLRSRLGPALRRSLKSRTAHLRLYLIHKWCGSSIYTERCNFKYRNSYLLVTVTNM